jgi:glycosyltransferase involved in cell wall biosynthesis
MTEPMRVLQVHTRYRQSGGEDGVVATEAALLEAAGHQVHTWEATNPPGYEAAISLAGAAWNPVAASNVRDAVRRFRPDVAHVHNTWFAASPSVMVTLHRLGVPVVMTLHNYRLVCPAATLYRDGAPCHDCLGSHPWHAVRHRCYRDSRPQSAVAAATIALHARRRTWHRDVDRFIALSEFGRQRFLEGGLPPDRIVVKPNSVDDPGQRDEPPSRSRQVVFVGRLTEEKGIRLLLDAWSRQPLDLELVIVGAGPLESVVRRAVSENVTYLGQQPHDDVSTLLRGARALVFPSTWYEGHPLVAVEAAAAGLPVVLPDLGAMSELFAPDVGELLFPAGDTGALAQRLVGLLDDRYVDHFGRLTRRRYEDRFTHERARHNLEEIYHGAAGDGN